MALAVSSDNDPMRIRQHMALKMVLNAHSTAVMAKLGKVVGNTMTNVSPSNLKLVGRATHLVQLHVNDVLGRPEWVRNFGARRPVSYEEANAVLHESIAFLKDKSQGGAAIGRSGPFDHPHSGIASAKNGIVLGRGRRPSSKIRLARLSGKGGHPAGFPAPYPMGGRPDIS